MTDRVIYSACHRMPGADDTAFRRLLEMMELWIAHLRGPGAFGGRIVLLTNLRDLPLADVETVPLGNTPLDRKELFRQRVVMYDRLPVRSGESWMQLDADTLAIRPIEPLFAKPGDTMLLASPSGLTALENAEPVLRRRARLWYGHVRRWRGRMGVSACLTTCMGEHWTRLMQPWAAAVHRYDAQATKKPVGDQGLLNLLYITRRIEIEPLPSGLIHHVRTDEELECEAAERAHVLHFPNARKLEMMKRRSVA